MEDDRYPTLARWLAGARHDNPWLEQLSRFGGADDAVLHSTETILRTLDSADPKRLATKRQAFRADRDQRNQLNLRVELLTAYRLVRASLGVEFGGAGQPDIFCRTSGGQSAWLEVTARDRDDLRALHEELEAAVAGLAVGVVLQVTERRVVIPRAQRNAMCQRVSDAARRLGPGDSATVALDEIGGTAGCTAVEPIGSQVMLDLRGESEDHVSQLERELFNVLEGKGEQARRGSWSDMTLLVVDASRLGLAWLGADAVWPGILESLSIDWSVLPFVGLMLAFSRLDSVELGGACVHRPSASEAEVSALNEILRAFGIPPFDG
jgi:hypothetical protein